MSSKKTLQAKEGDWVVKGFIDVYKNIYSISLDTKVVSKIIELILFPVISSFAHRYSCTIIPCEHQSHYPDLSFITPDDTKIALDLKSTYRVGDNAVNGFTLGAFTGYFRDRKSTKNITFKYEDYSAHFVLGVIYSRNDQEIDERKKYHLKDLYSIITVVRDFTFLFQEKWKLASDRPGSGNTKNIGSITTISDLIEGRGVFANYGESTFDDDWMNYLILDMAKAIDSPVPYRNFRKYLSWKKRP